MSAVIGSPALSRQVATPARGRGRGAIWLIAPGVLFLGVFLIFPILQLLKVSLYNPTTGAWSLDAFAKVFGSATYLRVLATTFRLALETTAVTLVVAYPIAYWLAFQPERRRRVLMVLVLIPFWVGALIQNFVWLVLLGRTGFLVKLAIAAGAPSGTELLFTHATVLFGMVHGLLPLAIITMLPTMLQVDQRLQLAAATLGASKSHAFWRVYFPLSMPGVAAAGLLLLVISLGFFITPALLGSPRETMIGQTIMTQILMLRNWPFGGALATILIVLTLVLCLVYNRLFGLSTVSGAGETVHQGDSAKHRFAAALLRRIAALSAAIFDRSSMASTAKPGTGLIINGYAAIVIALLLFPILALVPMAFTTSTFLSFPPPLFSTRWFEAYLASPLWMAATLRSFGIGIACACLTFLIAFPAAYGVARVGGRLANATFVFFLLPMVVPYLSTALALFYFLSQLRMVGTDTGIVIGHTVLAIPTVFIISLTTLKTYDWRLNQAAATLGATKWRSALRVQFPLMKSGLLASIIFAFLLSFNELAVVMFIGAGLKVTLPKQMWDDIQVQLSPTLVAASVFVLVVVVTMFLIVGYLRRRKY